MYQRLAFLLNFQTFDFIFFVKCKSPFSKWGIREKGSLYFHNRLKAGIVILLVGQKYESISTDRRLQVITDLF